MREEIVNLEEKLRLAMISSDVKVLNELISDELVFIAPNGAVADKEMDLYAHKTGLQKITKLFPSEQKILTFDNCAIVSVKMALEGTYDETNISGDYSYLRTWIKTNNRWQVVSGAVVKIIN